MAETTTGKVIGETIKGSSEYYTVMVNTLPNNVLKHPLQQHKTDSDYLKLTSYNVGYKIYYKQNWASVITEVYHEGQAYDFTVKASSANHHTGELFWELQDDFEPEEIIGRIPYDPELHIGDKVKCTILKIKGIHLDLARYSEHEADISASESFSHSAYYTDSERLARLISLRDMMLQLSVCSLSEVESGIAEINRKKEEAQKKEMLEKYLSDFMATLKEKHLDDIDFVITNDAITGKGLDCSYRM